uniref:Uncharacterized protein n=1 Tax=Coniothyrium glycines TaxID=1077358 RepID=A0A3G4S7N8_9PLEO|nr:hypothetical protein [Coniothyrium glycines]AYU74399.1 hypothetical protein [Coniothyrium glycines]
MRYRRSSIKCNSLIYTHNSWKYYMLNTFNNKQKMLIGFTSSVITAGIGYGIRFICLYYLEYDVFTNIDNWIASLSYFCCLGGIRFLINEYLKENIYLIHYCTGHIPVSNGTAEIVSLPVRSKSAGTIFHMDPSNNSATGSSSVGSSSVGNSSVGSSSVGDAPITDEHSEIKKRILHKQEMIVYYHEQLWAAKQTLEYLDSIKHIFENNGRFEDWKTQYSTSLSDIRDWERNISSDTNIHNGLQQILANGDRSTSTSVKRTINDSSMTNDVSSTPRDTKRQFNKK